ncbi:hypothetical protein [Spiroplasma endosymbiont of Cleonymus obscurus]
MANDKITVRFKIGEVMILVGEELMRLFNNLCIFVLQSTSSD